MAYGVMTIKYNSDNIEKKAKRVADMHNDGSEHSHGFITKLDNVREYKPSKNYLGNASAFLRKRKNEFDKKASYSNQFATRVSTFMDDVKDADARVAVHIEDTYKEFKQITGINNSLWGAIVGFIEKVFKTGIGFLMLLNPVTRFIAVVMAAAWAIEQIKSWYENLPDGWKYVIKLIGSAIGVLVEIAAFVAAFTAGTPLLAIACAIILLDASIKLGRDIKALNAYNSGNAGAAERISNMTTSEIFGSAMENMGICDAETAAFVYSLTVFVAQIVKVSIKFSTLYTECAADGGSKLDIIKQVFKRSLPFGDSQIQKGIKNLAEFKSASLFDKFMKIDIAPMLEVFSDFRTIYKVNKSIFVERFDKDIVKNINRFTEISSFNFLEQLNDLWSNRPLRTSSVRYGAYAFSGGSW